MMRKIVLSEAIMYGKEDVHELESASVKVQSIYDKAFDMLHRYLPESLRKRTLSPPSDGSSAQAGSHQGRTIFQKWIQGPSGWKCVGSERHQMEPAAADRKDSSPHPGKHEYIFRSGRMQSMLLQVLIWAQFEEIMLFHPFLGDAPFYTDEEMETISSYFVPTYVSEAPFIQLGKPYKKHRIAIPVYQEYISAPTLMMHRNNEVLEGTWMTGVYVDQEHFLGLGPYLKNTDGQRTFMQPLID